MLKNSNFRGPTNKYDMLLSVCLKLESLPCMLIISNRNNTVIIPIIIIVIHNGYDNGYVMSIHGYHAK